MRRVNKHKKKIIFLFTLTLILLFLVFTPEIQSMMKNDKIIIGAHRGSSINFTENSLEAINSALYDKNYNFIEFDIRYTKDKKIVLHHDNSLMRNHFSFKEISELNYYELQNYTDYYLPTLDEILKLISNKKRIIIEIKSTDNVSLDKEFTDLTIELIKKHNISNSNVMISSISPEIISYIEENYPQYKTGLVFWVLPISYLDTQDMVKDFYLNISSDYILLHNINLRSYDNLVELKPKDKTLLFWTFEDKIYLISDKKKFW